jgi:hypothetical protein
VRGVDKAEDETEKTALQSLCYLLVVNGRLAELKREKGVKEDMKIFFPNLPFTSIFKLNSLKSLFLIH